MVDWELGHLPLTPLEVRFAIYKSIHLRLSTVTIHLFFRFDFDPTIRTTAISGFVGSAVIGSVSLCANQAIPQRYMACKTISEARR